MVYERLAIQVAKCSARASPARERGAAPRRPSSAGHERRASGRGEGQQDQGGDRHAVERDGERRRRGEPHEDGAEGDEEDGERERQPGRHGLGARPDGVAARGEGLVEEVEALAAALGDVAAAAALAAERARPRPSGGRARRGGGPRTGRRRGGPCRRGCRGAPRRARARRGAWPGRAGRSGGQPSKAATTRAGEAGRGRRARRRGPRRAAGAPRPRGRARGAPLRLALALDEVVLRLLRGGDEVVERRRERRDEPVEDVLPARDRREGAVAADEGDARAALVALEGRDDDDADLGGGARVRAAAGLAVEALGLDDPDVGRRRPRAARRPWARASAAESVVTRTGRASQTISFARPLGRARLVGASTGRSRSIVVDLAAEVEGDRLGAGHLDEGPREQVLAVVLLHVVAAPLGVDAAVHPLAGQRAVEHVEDVRPVLERPRRRARRRACRCPRAGRRSRRRRRCGRGRRRAGPRARAGRPRRRRTRGG